MWFATLLELLGIALVAAFSFIVWPPLALLVLGTFALLIARHMSSPKE